jgi:hypothetical protein
MLCKPQLSGEVEALQVHQGSRLWIGQQHEGVASAGDPGEAQIEARNEHCKWLLVGGLGILYMYHNRAYCALSQRLHACLHNMLAELQVLVLHT